MRQVQGLSESIANAHKCGIASFPRRGLYCNRRNIGKDMGTNVEKDSFGTGDDKVDINRRDSPFKVILSLVSVFP